jgi:hypothetical protein
MAENRGFESRQGVGFLGNVYIHCNAVVYIHKLHFCVFEEINYKDIFLKVWSTKFE